MKKAKAPEPATATAKARRAAPAPKGVEQAEAASPAAPRKEQMGGLAKGLRIMESFSATQPKLSIVSAATLAGISPPAARRCLLTLEELGYLTYDGKFFHPTPRMSRLAVAYTETPLPRMAQAHLDAVRDATGKPVSLAVLKDNYAVFVARSEIERVVSTSARIGSRLPAHTASTGRVMLAGMDEKEFEHTLHDMLQLATDSRSFNDEDMIRKRVAEARRLGYSYSNEELEHGVRTLAVPIRDSRGMTQAAMSLSAFAHESSIEDILRKDLPILQRECQALGRKL